jgi:bifunctional UDP-N-acetylglucosamine pyrophosphorylase/glucosamine-1-phosphate N-acetyltransferase
MSIDNVQALVLAAGQAKRFKTNTSKLIQKICGQEMILYTTKALQKLNIETTAIVGYQKEDVMDAIKKYHGAFVTFITQDKQEGTGHAVLCSKAVWHKEYILILNGDMPLVTSSIIQQIYEKHKTTNATITLAVAHHIDPSGAYGRIVQTGNKLAIVEAKEFTGEIEDHPFINAGIYLVNRDFLEAAIATLNRSSVSNEFYLTDIIKIASDADKIVTPVIVPFDCVRGINNFKELWAAEQILRSELINHWMLEGVRFTLPLTNHLDNSVTIGNGSIIQSGVQLFGNTHIGNNCHIHSFSVLNNATIEDNVTILPYTVIDNSTIATNASVGPRAHIHSNETKEQGIVVSHIEKTKRSNEL